VQDVGVCRRVFGSGENGCGQACTMRIAASSSIGMWLDWTMRMLSTLPSRRTPTLITTSAADSGGGGLRRGS
jgi:hypothetical protein